MSVVATGFRHGPAYSHTPMTSGPKPHAVPKT